MKKIFLRILIIFVAVSFITNNLNAQNGNSTAPVLKHIVIISFKEDASPDSIKALDNVYQSLSKSPFVKNFEMGTDVSTRDTTHLKHVYVITFASKDDMQSYTKIPEHARLFKLSLPIADDVNVVDYWAHP
jgi:hypothetical protein